MIVLGVLIFLASVIPSFALQNWVNTTDVPLDGIWLLPDDGSMPSGTDYEALSGVLALGYLMRALGLILVGAGLYKTGFMQGALSDCFYQRMAIGGLAIWPYTSNNRCRDNARGRLRPRCCVHRRDSEYPRHHSRLARVHGP